MIFAARQAPVADPTQLLSRGLVGLLPPLFVLALAHCLGPMLASHLPTSLSGLRVWGPAMVLFLGTMLALTFNRGRMVFAALSLAGAYCAWQFQYLHALDTFAGRAVYAATCVFVPLNFLALSLLQERGIFSFYGMRRGLALLLQTALTAWIVASGQVHFVDWVFDALAGLPLPTSPIPSLAIPIMLVGSIVTGYRAVRGRSALDAGLTGALVAFALACHSVHQPSLFAVYVGAAGGALAVAVLQDTFRLAFRDELTGLPSRRALNERMLALGNQYTIAMVDVDRFKQFNDAHGHQLGDHVLRMVAAKLARVGCGGRAYRFGGEEFAIVFPGKHVHEVWPHLDALRQQIGTHALALRSSAKGDAPQGSAADADASVRVTVSIGLAERGERARIPAHVLIAADRALYRAKHKGRNRLSL